MANNYSPLQPGNTRIITRPNGAAEFLITDHLGSTRLSIKANHLPTELTPTVYQDTKYYAFGDVSESDGQGARTGYIGREVDSESDLGAYGVRNYESATGRFLSTDPLWELYTSWNPYQYSLNNPVTLLDDGGKSVTAISPKEKEVFASMLKKEFGLNITFNEHHQAVVTDADIFASSDAINGATGAKDYSEELGMFVEMINGVQLSDGSVDNTKDVQFKIVDEGAAYADVTLVKRDPETKELSSAEKYSVRFSTNNEGFFSHPDHPASSAVLFKPLNAANEQFKSVMRGELTPKSGVSLFIHGWLDHAYQWLKNGHNPSRKEGVKYHNRSLQRNGSGPLIRSEAYHKEKGN